MTNERMLIAFLKDELMENHDGHHRKPRSVEDMTLTECDPVSSG